MSLLQANNGAFNITPLLGAVIILASCFHYASAQNQPAIAWENMRTEYGSFYDIEPSIVNVSQMPIYFDSYHVPIVQFERYDEITDRWQVSDVWHCGTGYKARPQKIKPTAKLNIEIDREQWQEITDKDSIGVPKFRQLPGYDGTGKYRFKFSFGTKRTGLRDFVSYSPEFIVSESLLTAK